MHSARPVYTGFFLAALGVRLKRPLHATLAERIMGLCSVPRSFDWIVERKKSLALSERRLSLFHFLGSRGRHREGRGGLDRLGWSPGDIVGSTPIPTRFHYGMAWLALRLAVFTAIYVACAPDKRQHTASCIANRKSANIEGHLHRY